MSSQVDLRQLAVSRAPAAPSRSRRHLLARYVLPALLLVGFAALLGWSLREAFSSPRPVTVVPVLTARGPLALPADAPLFRAAGWVEPRPTPMLVTALAEGVVEELLVAEGQEVEKGQVVARLVRADAERDVRDADLDVRLREVELDKVRADPTVAKAEVALLRAEEELDALPARLKAARSQQRLAKQDLDYRERSASSPEATLRKARTDLDVADARLAEVQARDKSLPKEAAQLKNERDALKRLAKAKERDAQLRVAKAKVARDAMQLRLERMTIKAPTAGRVLALVARPGTRLTGLAPGSLHDSSTVVTLYDPARLQVRVDVRLDDVGKVRPGQKARVESAALPGGAVEGEVLLATSQADIQKNTLSVKVGIKAPTAALRPDMLCQVTFLAPPGAPAGGEPAGTPRLLVPRQLVEVNGGEGVVWVADQVNATARRVTVRLGTVGGELVEVVSGLSSSDKLIASGREGLRHGERIRVTGEDESMGRESGGAR